MRLQMKDVVEWKIQQVDTTNCNEETILKLVEPCSSLCAGGKVSELYEVVRELSSEMDDIQNLLEQFCEESGTQSMIFSYWNNYLDMLRCLLYPLRV